MKVSVERKFVIKLSSSEALIVCQALSKAVTESDKEENTLLDLIGEIEYYLERE